MRDLLGSIHQRWAVGDAVAVATVVDTFMSAPRAPGATMVVTSDGAVVGSVSGGCVESAVYEIALEVLQSGIPQLHRFGVSDDDAFAVGLTCGGILDVFVERVDAATFPELDDLVRADDGGRPAVVATVVDHPVRELVGRRLVVSDREEPAPETLSSVLDPRLIRNVLRDAQGLLSRGETRSVSYGLDGSPHGREVRVFVESFARRARMLVFGAIDFAASMATMGLFLGYQVTVCDARPVFATRARFPGVDDVVVDWPHRYLAREQEAGRVDERTVVCVLTHDPKFDVPLLEIALKLPSGVYVGAMGSRRTHQQRLERLRECGLTQAELSRLASPIGLDLGARTPEETAVSIAAEVIAQLRGGSGSALRETDGPIHASA